MLGLSRKIPGAGYNDRGDTLGFHLGDLSVLVERRRITMIGAQDEATARGLMDWLKQVSTLKEQN